jgi:hypothetical protein
MKTGDKAIVDPKLTGLSHWIEGIIIKIRNNPFLGKEIVLKDNLGNIYFDSAKYFKTVSK